MPVRSAIGRGESLEPSPRGLHAGGRGQRRLDRVGDVLGHVDEHAGLLDAKTRFGLEDAALVK
jgi:hypothetical protein